MREDIWKILKDLENEKISTNEAYKLLCVLFGVSARYLCECGKTQTKEEMRREMDFGYDQLCCTACGNVMIDDLHNVVHCNVC